MLDDALLLIKPSLNHVYLPAFGPDRKCQPFRLPLFVTELDRDHIAAVPVDTDRGVADQTVMKTVVYLSVANVRSRHADEVDGVQMLRLCDDVSQVAVVEDVGEYCFFFYSIHLLYLLLVEGYLVRTLMQVVYEVGCVLLVADVE